MPMTENFQKFTLLVVDDTPTNLALLAQIIELDLPEVRVLTARSAEDGLELAGRETIDGAFIDVQMPGMNGLEMCRRLRNRPATGDLPIVLMTAHLASPELRAEGLEAGAYDFIIQPISNLEMLARIKVMLRLCDNERQAPSRQQATQRQKDDHARRMRWLSGLLISGDGSLNSDRTLLEGLAETFPDPATMTDREFFGVLARDFPPAWRRTLLKLGLFEQVPLPLARQLSEIQDVAAVFEYLWRHDLVLRRECDRDICLLFKPDSRDFLRGLARQQLTAAEQTRVYQEAADWFEQQGDAPAALACLIPAQQYPAISRLFSQQALQLFDGVDHSRVADLSEEIPERIAAGCGWLALLKGMAQLRSMSLTADDWLELAYQRFSRDADERGCLLALTQQILQAVFLDGRFERCAERLPELRRLAATRMPEITARERLKVGFSLGLAELFPGGRPERVEDLLGDALAEARQRQLPRQQLELHLLRALTAYLQGRSVLARSAFEDARALCDRVGNQLEEMVLQVIACALLHGAGDLEGFVQQQQTFRALVARRIRRNTFFSALLGYLAAGLHLARGQEQKARELLEMSLSDGRAAAHAHLHSRILQFKGWLDARAGSVESARALLEEALKIRREAGEHGLRLENLLFSGLTWQALGKPERAREALEQGLAESRLMGEERLRPGFHVWLAVLHQQQGETAAARDQAVQGRDLLRRHRDPFFWGLTPDVLDILQTLLPDDGSRQFLAEIFEHQLGMGLDHRGQQLPLLKIRTLGGFQVELENRSCDLSRLGQPSRQLLALLTVASEQRLSSEVVMARLWPESSGEKARNSFDTAHSRLRKGLEEQFGKRIRDAYLVLEKGMLALRHVWIDSREFSSAMTRARYHLQRENNWQAERFLWTMDQLWHGEFLQGHEIPDELLVERRELIRLRLEQIGALAQRLIRTGQSDQAEVLLRKGLAIDPLQDALIRKLLEICQQRQDERAARVLLDDYQRALDREDYAPEEIEELVEALGAPGFTREHITKES